MECRGGGIVLAVLLLISIISCSNNPETFTVTFDTKGGSAIESITAVSGSVIEKPENDPERSGYDFKGWYLDEECTETVEFPYTVTGDVTFYAKWTYKYTAPSTVSVRGVSLDRATLSLKKDETETLIATVSPSNATNKNVSWSSSNEEVATVDNGGKVTGVKAGEAMITVTTADGSKTATCTVVVQKTQLNVTFYDGNGDFLKTIAVAENEAIDTSDLPDLSKISGTDFKTWFSDEDLKSVFDFSTPITSSIPVYGGVYSDTNIKINKNGVLSTTADGRENISGDLVIPYGVTEIKNEAFKGSGITSVSLPNGLKRIGESSFEGCKNLTGSLVIPESVNKIDYCAFKNTSITSAVLKTTNLMYELNGDGDYRDLFKSCTELETVTLSSGVDTIAMGMFYGCTKLSKIDISEGCKYIMGNSFNGCTSLERIEIPSSVISISDANGNPDSYAFSGCINLKSIEINKPKDSIEFAPWDCPNEDAVKWLG